MRVSSNTGVARASLFALMLTSLLLGCISAPRATDASQTPSHTAPAKTGQILGRNERLLIYQSAVGESLADVAQRFLGSPDQDWVIGDFNHITQADPAKPMVVPLKPLNPMGVYSDRYQTVPILCYHRFNTNANGGAGKGAAGKMTVSAADFAAQLEWLARNGFHVLRLSQLEGWLAGKQPLPLRSVIITADDGYASFYRVAYPLLKKHGFAASLFVYTDFIGGGDAVSWPELQEMAASGLVDVQAHSRTHRNLIERSSGESDERYQQALLSETRVPREMLARKLGTNQRHYAYPYGDANEAVLDALARQGVQLAATVNPGGNAFFAQPLMLQRTMIYGDMSLDEFKARLQISKGLSTR